MRENVKISQLRFLHVSVIFLVCYVMYVWLPWQNPQLPTHHFPPSSQCDPVKTSCQATPLLSARGRISLSALSTPLCLSDFSSYSPLSSLSPNTLDFLQVFKTAVLIVLLSLCSLLCWKCFHPTHPWGSLCRFLRVFAFQ